MSDQGSYVFPVPSHLGNDLVELVPFEVNTLHTFDLRWNQLFNPPSIPPLPQVAKHAQLMVDGAAGNPDLFKWLPYKPYTSLAEFQAFYNQWIVPDSTIFMFVIKDKVRNSGANVIGEVTAENIAGVITLMSASVAAAQAELGHIMILPRSQRTHVLTNACGLLMEYSLNKPEEGGLGLRRLQWQANAENGPSRTAALRLGFRFEGILRWHRVLAEGKIGPGVRDDGRGPGRHTAILSCCFDDWEGGEKEAIKQKMVLRKKE